MTCVHRRLGEIGTKHSHSNTIFVTFYAQAYRCTAVRLQKHVLVVIQYTEKFHHNDALDFMINNQKCRKHK